jgi:hypothetical protein
LRPQSVEFWNNVAVRAIHRGSFATRSVGLIALPRLKLRQRMKTSAQRHLGLVLSVGCALASAACSDAKNGPGPAFAGAAGVDGSNAGEAGEGGSAGSSDSPGVRFVGRVDVGDAAGARFAWSGTGIVARFTGQSIAVRLNGGQEYTVLVDGALQPKLKSTGGSDPLATGLGSGEHVVELYRRTEANQGEAQFLGFDIAGGELLPAPPAPERRIEVIGDSISCGYGNEGADMTCGFTPETENHYLTFGAIAAREAGADLVTVAWSGKGVVCNYGDEPTSCVDPMPIYYPRTLPDRQDSEWDFAQYQPQAVVINLGTNDFSTVVDPSQADFEAAYVSLLTTVREAYADAVILCTVGPLLGGADLTTARLYIADAVAQRVAAGDTKVKTFELAPTDPNDGYGCDYHPSLVTHQKMADVLSSVLEEELGW